MTACLSYSRGLKPFLVKFLKAQEFPVLDDTIEGKVIIAAKHGQISRIPFVERLFYVLGLQKHSKETNKREVFNSLFGFFSAEAIGDFLLQSEAEDGTKKNTFRVSIKTSGKWRRKINSVKLAESLSRTVKKNSRLAANLRKPDVEFTVQITDNLLFVGIPNPNLLSTRPYHLKNGLRSTVCDAMVHLAELESGQIVADITCGSGSILVEASHSVLPEQIFCVGLDLCQDALITAKDNMEHQQKIDKSNSQFDLACTSVSDGFFRWENLDRIVADLPFGNQHGDLHDIKAILLPTVLQKFFTPSNAQTERKIAVLLIAEEHSVEFVKSVKETLGVSIDKHSISLGFTSAMILKIWK
ncbi:hypothetical protein L596_027620 [Steinernema carpocapsae]|uniref:Ribosomal RNA large subunit methyltransferase K/L-like methyltransferase domain-containing protein n=1 Tax=Steinernema carpocapsae TaxID=34508 RepID=A0A4U5LW08_STECR|nr:hypothetical protein L596_027620 [Steinernema carpocapsae]